MSEKVLCIDAYEAGKDCAMNGATLDNSHYRFFTDSDLKDSWQKGYDLISKEQTNDDQSS